MILAALSFYMLDFFIWFSLHYWLIHSFFVFSIIYLLKTNKKSNSIKGAYLLLTLLTIQNSFYYGNALVSLAVSITLILALTLLKSHFDTKKPIYGFLTIIIFYCFELFFIKPYILHIASEPYFTYEAIFANLVLMSILLGIQGNRSLF